MIINTAVPDVVYEQLSQGQTIQAKTNFENHYSPKAYKMLAKVANMENFFFGIVPASESRGDLELHLTESDAANNKILTLDIPEENLFIHDFYGFSGLIYDCEDYDNLNLSDETLWDYAKSLHLIDADSTVQVIYPELRPEWLIKADDVNTFDFHDTDESLKEQADWQNSQRFAS